MQPNKEIDPFLNEALNNKRVFWAIKQILYQNKAHFSYAEMARNAPSGLFDIGDQARALKRELNKIQEEMIAGQTIILNNTWKKAVRVRYVRVEIAQNNPDLIQYFDNLLRNIPYISEICHIEGDWDYLIRLNVLSSEISYQIITWLAQLDFIENVRIVANVIEQMPTNYHELDGLLEKDQPSTVLEAARARVGAAPAPKRWGEEVDN